MNTSDILAILKLASDLDGLESLLSRLIALNISTEQLFAFAREHKVSVTLAASVLIIAATLNTSSDTSVIDPRWTAQTVTSIKHYKSGSGNPTWRCTLADGGEVYVRQSNKQAWIDAGFGALERMSLNTTWDANILIYTLPGEKNFLDVMRVEAGGTLTEVADTRVAEAANTAWKWLNVDNIYMLDFETTGLDNEAQIVSYCVRDARCNILGSGLVKPTISIPQAATDIHSVTDDDVKDAPSLLEATIDGFTLPDFLNRFLDRIVTWNASFDARLYRQSMHAHGVETNTLDWRCAMTLYSGAFGTWNDRRSQYDFISLEKAAKAEGITYVPHSAFNDTLAAVQVLDALARRSMPF